MDERDPGKQALEAESRMRSVVDHVVDGIITISDRGIVTTFNPAAERIFGYAAREVVGENIKMLMPEPDRSAHDGYLANYLRTGQAKIIGIGREVVGRRKSGATFPMELAISEFRLGEHRYFTGIVRDITERKRAEEELRRAEERMRSVVDHVVDGIITIDEHGSIESFNPAAEKLFGFARDEVIGKNVKLLMPQPYHGEHDGYIANYVHTGVPKIIGIGREVVGLKKNGTTFPMELAVSEFHIGERRYFTGIVRDITDRKRLELELHDRLQQLAEADQQKNQFLAMLSHELRNPLAPMRNALSLMKHKGANERMISEARDLIERQLHHLVRLVDDLLDVSRITTGKLNLRREQVDARAVAQSAIEAVEPLARARGHSLRVALPPPGMMLEADPTRLAQVFLNLLNNAVKFTDPGGRIDFEVEVAAGELVARVRDSGVGIAAEMREEIFEMFAQADRSLERSTMGLGVGLSLARRLVELHGGTISVSSAGPGKGAEFVVRIPVCGGSVVRPDSSFRENRSLSAKPHRILLADDNLDFASSFATLLRRMGNEVRVEHDGPAALAAAPEFRPEIAFLDIGLPKLNGFDLARRLRELPATARSRLVAVTGWGQPSDRQLASEAGFDDYMVKPVEIERIQAILRA